MRRTLIVLAGLGMVATGLACNHTSGKCDCLPLVQPCLKYGLYTPESCGLVEQHAPKRELIPAPSNKPAELPATKPAGLE